MSGWSDDEAIDFGSGSEGDGEQSLSNMFFEAKTKGISDDSYDDWAAIVAKECETDESRNFSFKASKRIFRIEIARGDFAKAAATFERLVSFIPKAEPNAVRKAFLNRKQAKNLLHVVCPKLNLVPYLRKRSAIEKTDAEIPFILFLHETLRKAVEAKRSTFLDVWKACSLRLAKLRCCLGEVGAALDIISGGGGLCSLYRDDSGKDSTASASNLIELYAFLSSMYCDRKEWHLLKAILERVELILPSVTGNGTDIALIRECEGIIFCEKKMWNLAFKKFHESFTKFCESNHDRRVDLLMTCVVIGCLTDRATDEAQRAEKMEDMPEVRSLMQVKDSVKTVIELTKSFRTHDMFAFQAALRGPAHQIVDANPFLSGIVGDLLHKLRKESIHSILYPKLQSSGLSTKNSELQQTRPSPAFSRVHLSFFAKRLDIPIADVERLLILILLEDQSVPVHERSIHGKLDQTEQVLVLDSDCSGVASDEWMRALASMGKDVARKFDSVVPAVASGGGGGSLWG